MLTYSTIVPATIGTLQCDCIVDHVTTFSSQVTEHPIEGGFVIADHVARQAMKLSLTAIITPNPSVISASWVVQILTDWARLRPIWNSCTLQENQ